MVTTLRAMFNGQCHKKALIHVFAHASIALIPLTAVVVMFLYGTWKGMFFMENGEFYIYSVVFFTMALYALVSLGLKKDSWGLLVIIWTILFLVASLILYGSLIHDKIVAVSKPPVEASLFISSWVLLAVSLVTFYVATYWEFYRDHIANKKTDDRDGIEDIKSQLP